MSLMLALVVALLAINLTASVLVLRTSVFSRSQRLLQVVLVWLVPVIGAVICVAFVFSQRLAPGSSGSLDPLYLPSDGNAADCSSLDAGGHCDGDGGGGSD